MTLTYPGKTTPASCANNPTTASIAIRQCFNSASLNQYKSLIENQIYEEELIL